VLTNNSTQGSGSYDAAHDAAHDAHVTSSELHRL